MTDLNSFAKGMDRNRSADGFISNEPEHILLDLIYNDPSRRQVTAIACPQPTIHLILALQEIKVTQEIIGKKSDWLFL